MKSIGIRVHPKLIYFTIVEFSGEELSLSSEVVEKIIVPVALDTPNQLAFIRQTLISIITEFGIETAGIRITEPIAKNVNFQRLNIEGVIQELLANSTVENYLVGTISTMSKHLYLKQKELSRSFKEKTPPTDYEFLSMWSTLKKEEKESLMMAIAALRIER